MYIRMTKRSMPRPTTAYVPHILFVGNTGVGKTTLIQKVSGIEVDPDSSRPTMKSDFVEKQMIIGAPPSQETIKVRFYDQPFDMGGSPNSILRNRDIIVLVWSLTDTESYRKIHANLTSICNTDAHNPYPPHIVLCASKCDESRNDNEFNLCCEKYKQYPIIKTSVDGTGIDQLEAKFRNILAERYNKKCDNNLETDGGSIELSERLRVTERPEPNCC